LVREGSRLRTVFRGAVLRRVPGRRLRARSRSRHEGRRARGRRSRSLLGRRRRRRGLRAAARARRLGRRAAVARGGRDPGGDGDGPLRQRDGRHREPALLGGERAVDGPCMVSIRRASPTDVPALKELIPLSARELSRGFYTDDETESAILHVFGPDSRLIADGTYFVAEDEDGRLAGCGGSRRRRPTLSGHPVELGEEPPPPP